MDISLHIIVRNNANLPGFLPVVQGRVDGFPEIRRTDISAPDGFYNGIKYLNFTGNVIING